MNAQQEHRSDIILDRLLSLHPKLIDLTLDRLIRLLAAIGNPERNVPPVIHVAGTNGKGSTIAFLRAMLESAGYRVHAYTSPHLVRFHERIRLAGTLIAEPHLQALLEECEAANDGQPITFFEITTAAAFLAFSREPADILLLEVGLGGRLDATNVIDRPLVTAITPVALDHQHFLGSTLAGIAREKAGIIKNSTPCVVGPQPPEALDEIHSAGRKFGAPIVQYGQEWSVHEEGGRLVYQDESGLLDLPLPALTGRHQIVNAGQAIAALRAQHLFEISEPAFEAGLTAARWPGRLQRLTSGPLVDAIGPRSELWLDGGHNPAAGLALAAALGEIEERDPRPTHLILGMLDMKDSTGFLKPFIGLARSVTCIAVPGEPNSADAKSLAVQAAGLGFDTASVGSVREAARRITGQTSEPLRILICGSLYLAGTILAENA